MTKDRVVLLEQIHNFRDYGGYSVSGGGWLRMGELFRSAHHAEATPGDLETIERLGISTVIDLRGNREREIEPSRRPENFAGEIVALDLETGKLPPHLAAALAGNDAAAMRRRTVEIYRNLPFRHSLIPLFRRYFQVLAARPGSSVIHCLAGKDRTGMAVALFHEAVGVHPDDAMQDYLLTNTAGDPEARIAAGSAAILRHYGKMSDAGLRTIMGVEPEYMEAARAAIVERFGSILSYLDKEIGVDASFRERLRARFVES